MTNKQKLATASKLLSEVLKEECNTGSPSLNKEVRKQLASARKSVNFVKSLL